MLCLGFTAPHELQHKFIDAAAEAGVEYVFPVEFGGDTDDEALGKVVPMLAGKKKVREYIESVGKSKWIGIVNNPWTLVLHDLLLMFSRLIYVGTLCVLVIPHSLASFLAPTAHSSCPQFLPCTTIRKSEQIPHGTLPPI